MLRKSGIILVMLIAVAALVMASASAMSTGNSKKTDTGDWVATPATLNSWSQNAMTNTFTTTAPGNVYYITQGQAQYYSFYVPPGSTGVTVDLNWGNPANSLQYTMFAADGSVAGPYYDNADGRIDGRICIYLSRNGAIIPSGTYYDMVYGYSVTGVQSYTI